MSRRQPVVARLLVGLGCYFFLNGIVQSLVSIRGVAAGLNGAELGLVLGLASGALGIVVDMPVAQRADQRGKYPIVQVGLACSLAAGLALLSGGRALLVVGAVLAGLGASAGGNSLLSWLATAVPPAGQARLQGLNGSVQRIGALLAAGLVGLAIAVGVPADMAAGAAVAAAVGLVATRASTMRQADRAATEIAASDRAAGGIARGGSGGVLASYRRGFRMLSRPGLVLAAGINLAVNVIFLETNSYVPLVHGPHRAIIVTGTLVARDLAAVAVGAGLAATGLNVAYPALVASGLAVAGACAWAGGLATGSLALIALGGVQGAVMGMCIAASNLFTIGAIPAGHRTLAMAAAVFPSRVLYITLPIASSVVLRSSGLPDVFRLFAVILILLAAAALIIGRLVVRAARVTGLFAPADAATAPPPVPPASPGELGAAEPCCRACGRVQD